MAKIAALFVITNGVYFGLPDVDPWDIHREARLYAGPYPVIAHPPCERWGRYWSGGPMLANTPKRKTLGDDQGCFKAALLAVRRWGGILEHPEGSHAWPYFGLSKPKRKGGWIEADGEGGWTCCIEQGHYGHRARKATWLYVHSVDLPELRWGPSGKKLRLDDGYHSSEERRRSIRTGVCQRLSKKERAATPHEFRDLLIDIAKNITTGAFGRPLE